MNSLLNTGDISPISLAASIKEIIFENINDAKVKVKKSSSQEKTNSEPWFDKECESEKSRLNFLAKKMRSSPNDNDCRKDVFQAKKSFNRIITAKKRRYRANLFNDLQDKRKNRNIKEYWKVFRKISPKNKSNCVQPSMSTFKNYFEKLSNTDRPQKSIEKSDSIGPLDYEITEKELEDAGKNLKAGKSTGLDQISNEAISVLIGTHPKLVLKLFNIILDSGEIIPEWLIGLIVPIHKDGAKLDPGNYRGITLMSCLGKLFLSILNSRLMKYVLDKNILCISQLGFTPGNRTSDAHIIINHLVNKICHKGGGKIFSCFVDFKKAFDSVPRDLLLSKLLKFGINGKFFNIVQGIYTNDQACMKMENKRGSAFNINLGVRQGCVLSPLLFNIFLCDLAKNFQDLENAPEIEGIGINSLFWADDLVLFSKDEKGLQEMLCILEKYCKENYLLVNTKKTKCMIFNKTGRLLLRRFVLNDVQLEVVRSYKYLGLVITPSGELGTGMKDLRDRAFRAFMKIKGDLGSSFSKNVPLCLSLFDTLIKPILLYACDFWGCLKIKKSNPIENFYMRILKQILGVQKQTTNIGVLLELGKFPLAIEAKRLCIKNWERIKAGKANALVLAVHKDLIKKNLPGISSINHTLE